MTCASDSMHMHTSIINISNTEQNKVRHAMRGPPFLPCVLPHDSLRTLQRTQNVPSSSKSWIEADGERRGHEKSGQVCFVTSISCTKGNKVERKRIIGHTVCNFFPLPSAPSLTPESPEMSFVALLFSLMHLLLLPETASPPKEPKLPTCTGGVLGSSVIICTLMASAESNRIYEQKLPTCKRCVFVSSVMTWVLKAYGDMRQCTRPEIS